MQRRKKSKKLIVVISEEKLIVVISEEAQAAGEVLVLQGTGKRESSLSSVKSSQHPAALPLDYSVLCYHNRV